MPVAVRFPPAPDALPGDTQGCFKIRCRASEGHASAHTK